MNVAHTCPTPEQLGQLIHGTLSDGDNERLTTHIENCRSCQNAMQTAATGEIPIDSLVSDLHDLNPPDESSYWTAIARVEKELASPDDEVADDHVPDHGHSPDRAHASPANAVPPSDIDFLEPSDDPAYIGRLHHFQIARIIGRGGMGIVFEGFDTHLHRSVAIKVLNPQYQTDEIARQRFCREGRAAAAIAHEHVVPMYHVAKLNEGEVAFLVMQLIEGETLEDRLQEGEPLSAIEVARIGMQITAGLSAAHRQGMVHRDIKPANVMIEAETGRVKLTDFGLARATHDVKLTRTGMVTGTPLYMSPEQTLGDAADERSDLFSVGAVMYEMACGVAPFQAASAIGVMKRIMDVEPEAPHKVNAAVPRPLSDLIMSLLSKEREDRPESASDVAKVLATIVNEYGPLSPLQVPAVAARQVRELSGSYRRIERRWAMLAWGFAAAAVMIAATIYATTRPDNGDTFPSILLPDNPGTVWSVDFAPDGKKLASAVEDGSVRIWDVETQQLSKSFSAHRGIVWMVAYHPSKPLVMTSGDDSSVKLWDSESFELIREWQATSAVRGAAFSPDGRRLVAGDRNGKVHVYDIESGQEVASRTHPGSILGVDYSHDGKLIASVGSEKTVFLFDAETLELRNSLTGHSGPIYNVKFAAHGPMIASVGWNKNVRVWNTETGTEMLNLNGSEGDVWGVDFCSDGNHLVTSEQMGATRVWELSSGRAIVTLRGHTSAVHNVSLDPTSHRVATSSRDGTIRVWDMSSLAVDNND